MRRRGVEASRRRGQRTVTVPPEAGAPLLAFQLAHANRRRLASWADAIALGGERPRRRPTRRRRTTPLGTWTPRGHITQR
ncbi:hypothetical protein ACFY4H_14620 [Streptomyces althioticus]|uniref:hypothetical protein n=1 Tax=Streptomyces althioticus TaxID=83380 RepID=UPI00367D9E2C